MRDNHLLNLIEKASKISQKSSMNQKHGALLLNKKNIIIGTYNTFPHHAEHAIINKIKLLNNGRSSRKLIILVVRILKNGNYSNSRPCNHCINRMKLAGISRVIYTTGDKHVYAVERPRDMKLLHVSSGYAHRISLGGKTCLIN